MAQQQQPQQHLGHGTLGTLHLQLNPCTALIQSSHPILPLFGQIFPPYLIKQHPKNDDSPAQSLGTDIMFEGICRNTDGNHLPHRHDNGEDDGTEFLDGVIDA